MSSTAGYAPLGWSLPKSSSRLHITGGVAAILLLFGIVTLGWHSNGSAPYDGDISGSDGSSTGEGVYNPYWTRPPVRAVFDINSAKQACEESTRNCLDWAQKDIVVPASSPHQGEGDGDGEGQGEGKGVQIPAKSQQLYHTFWEGLPGEEIRLLVLSWLYTQRPDSELWIWLHHRPSSSAPSSMSIDIDTEPDTESSSNDFDKSFATELESHLSRPPWSALRRQWRNRIQFKPFNPNALAPADYPRLDVAAFDAAKLSDMCRFLVLSRHGGVYVDGDMIFVRDMTPLMRLAMGGGEEDRRGRTRRQQKGLDERREQSVELEARQQGKGGSGGNSGARSHGAMPWAYDWSCKNHLNTAVLGMRAGDPLFDVIFEGAKGKNFDFHPQAITDYVGQGIVNLPVSAVPHQRSDRIALHSELHVLVRLYARLRQAVRPSLPRCRDVM